MSSILTSPFEKNLERVSSTTQRAARVADDATVPKSHTQDGAFARVLGDLQKQAKVLTEQVPNSVECGDGGVLTNLNLGEHSSVNHSGVSLQSSLATPTVAPVVLLPSLQASPLASMQVPPQEIAVQPVSRFVAPLTAPAEGGEKSSLAAPELLSARLLKVPTQQNTINQQEPRNKLAELRSIIKTASESYGVNPDLSFAVAKAESSLRVYAISQDGHSSKGLFQLLDSTAKEMMARTGQKGQKYDPFNAKQNSELGNAYLRRLHDLFGKESNLGWNIKTVPASSAGDLEKLAVAAFNAGEGRVARAQARAQAAGKNPGEFDAIRPYLPASTQQYVQRVLGFRDEMIAAASPSTTPTETV